MSFVSIIASPMRVSAVSDGTLVDVNENGEIVKLPGAKPSLIRISEAQLIASTGSATVLKGLREQFPYKKEAYVTDETFYEQLKQAADSIPYSNQDVLIALADITRGVSCRIISNQPQSTWQTLIPDTDRLAALYLAGRTVNEEHIKEIAAEADRKMRLFGKNTPEQIFRAQKSLNRFVARLDGTVGIRTFKMILEC